MKKMYLKKAFTLVELIVVVAIISILLLIAFLKYYSTQQSAQMKTFETNAKVIMEYANHSVINNNGTNKNVYIDVNPEAISMKNKPKLSTYEIDSSTKIITCTLKKEAFGGTEDYVITYDTSTSEIKQTPNPLPNGATNIATN